jgi:hypothetical protein
MNQAENFDINQSSLCFIPLEPVTIDELISTDHLI